MPKKAPPEPHYNRVIMGTLEYPTVTQKRNLLEHFLLSLFLGLLTFFLAMGLFIIGFEIVYAGRIFPGVSMAGIDLSGLTPSEAADKINQDWSYPKTGRVLLQDGDSGWVATPQELGLFLDPGASASRAFDYGRSGGLIARAFDQFDGWYEGVDLTPALVFDQRLARNYLTQLAAQIDKPVVEANLGVQGTEVIVRSGETGRTLDIDASLAAITDQVTSLQDGLVPLVINETQPVILNVDEQADIARQILSQPLTLTIPTGMEAQGAPFVLEPATLAGMLSIERVRDGDNEKYRVGLNPDLLIQYLSSLAPGLQQYPLNARFIFNDDTRQLDLLQNAIIGRQLNIQNSLNAIQDAVEKGQHAAELAFDITNPQVTDDAKAADLGITEAVSVQSSYF